MANKTTLGKQGESIAKHYLLKQGLSLMAQNCYSPYGEIDLIMQENQEWVFVEVRYRKTMYFGGGLESVTPAKQKKLIKTAEHYMQSHHKIAFDACRFDIIEISGDLKEPKVNWVRDAFQVN